MTRTEIKRCIKWGVSFIQLPLNKLLIDNIKKPMLKKIIDGNIFSKFPIYIISYNRLEYLKQTVEWLHSCGYSNIIVIDNKSTDESLLNYYDSCDYKVIRLKKNYGYKVFSKCPRFFFTRNFSFYVLTDPDLMPKVGNNEDYIEKFIKTMYYHPYATKVGSSIEIGDLPDDYYLKDTVVEWESYYWQKLLQVDDDGTKIYQADIDTTFAVCSPNIFVARINRLYGIRVGQPYVLRHLPWYVSNSKVENESYIKTLRNDVSTWNGNRERTFITDSIPEREEINSVREKINRKFGTAITN